MACETVKIKTEFNISTSQLTNSISKLKLNLVTHNLYTTPEIFCLAVISKHGHLKVTSSQVGGHFITFRLSYRYFPNLAVNI